MFNRWLARQSVECLVSRNALGRHQDAFGLPDHVSALKGFPQAGDLSLAVSQLLEEVVLLGCGHPAVVAVTPREDQLRP